VQASFNPEGSEDALTLRKGVAIEPLVEDFNGLVRSRLLCQEFYVASAHQDIVGVGGRFRAWHDYVAQQFLRLYQIDKTFNFRVSTFVQSLKSDAQACRVLTTWLDKRGHPDLALKIHRQLDQRELYVSGNLNIIATENGYVARRPNSSLEVAFTNFLIRVDTRIWFDDVQEMFYAGRVVINHQEFPILLPKSSLQKPHEIAHLALSAVRQLQTEHPPHPSIIDTTYKRHLTSVIEQQAASKPEMIGVRRLGWNKTKTAFITPTWQARALKILPTSRVAYPGTNNLGYFSFNEFRFTESAEVSPHLRSFIAIMAALLGRTYRDEPTPPVRILSTPAMRQLMRGLCTPLGQQRIWEININRRSGNSSIDPEFFSGYPIYASCFNDAIVKDLNYPVFLLGDSGLPLQENLTQDSFQAFANLSYQVITRLTQGLIRETGGGYLRSNQPAPSAHELILEGKRAIEALCGLGEFVIYEDHTPLFKSALAFIDFDKIPEFFRFDIETQKYYFNFRHLDGPRRRDIFDELLRQKIDVALVGKYQLSLPLEWTDNAWKAFYGKKPELYHRAPGPEEEDNIKEGQDGAIQLVTA
jgi:hypothetical protein